jgi:hypothetical protein
VACISALVAEARAPAAPRANDAANAESPEIALEWAGPGPERTCLGAERLAAAVDDYLGRPAFVTGSAAVTLVVHVEPLGDSGWRALVRFRENDTGAVLGERVLTTDSALCSGLDEPLELAVALMVDSEIVANERRPETLAPAEPEKALPAAPARRPAQKPVPVRYSAEALAVAEFGLLPEASAGLELGFAVEPLTWLVLRAGARGFLPRSSALGSAELWTSLMLGELAICPTLRTGSVRLSACAGADGGAYLFRSHGLSGETPSSRPLWSGSFGARGAWQLGRHFALLGALSALIPIRPERFVYDLDGQSTLLFQANSPSLVAGLGCSAIF